MSSNKIKTQETNSHTLILVDIDSIHDPWLEVVNRTADCIGDPNIPVDAIPLEIWNGMVVNLTMTCYRGRFWIQDTTHTGSYNQALTNLFANCRKGHSFYDITSQWLLHLQIARWRSTGLGFTLTSSTLYCKFQNCMRYQNIRCTLSKPRKWHPHKLRYHNRHFKFDHRSFNNRPRVSTLTNQKSNGKAVHSFTVKNEPNITLAIWTIEFPLNFNLGRQLPTNLNPFEMVNYSPRLSTSGIASSNWVFPSSGLLFPHPASRCRFRRSRPRSTVCHMHPK